MSDLPKQLRIKAGMIHMGERIAWGSDTTLMEQAADLIEQLQARVAEQDRDIELLRKSNAKLCGQLSVTERERDTLAAHVEDFVNVRDWLPDARKFIIEFEKLVHKSPTTSLAERDAELISPFAASIGALCEVLEKCLDSTIEDDLRNTIECLLETTPTTSLAEHDAEVIKGFVGFMLEKYRTNLVEHADEYAEKLERGKS